MVLIISIVVLEKILHVAESAAIWSYTIYSWDCLKQGIMPFIAYIAMNTLISYGIFMTPILCVHVTVKKML